MPYRESQIARLDYKFLYFLLLNNLIASFLLFTYTFFIAQQ